MATYGGGTVFVSLINYIDITGGGTTALLQITTANVYAEFKALSFRAITTNFNFDGKFFIENDNGAGGWVRDPVAFSTTSGSGFVSAGYTEYAPGDIMKIVRGQRIVAVNNNGTAGQTMRFAYSYNQFTPST